MPWIRRNGYDMMMMKCVGIRCSSHRYIFIGWDVPDVKPLSNYHKIGNHRHCDHSRKGCWFPDALPRHPNICFKMEIEIRPKIIRKTSRELNLKAWTKRKSWHDIQWSVVVRRRIKLQRRLFYPMKDECSESAVIAVECPLMAPSWTQWLSSPQGEATWIISSMPIASRFLKVSVLRASSTP